jgi:cell division protein FtsB
MMRSVAESSDIESIMQWFNGGIEDGENGILVYPNLQTFRQIYTQYVKVQLAGKEEEEQKEIRNDDGDDNDYLDNDNRRKVQLLMPRIILIATFYDTVNAVKHNLSAVGVDVQSHIDHGSLLIVDAFDGYYPNTAGMNKLVVTLSERARKEGRIGVSVISNMGFNCYHASDYENLVEIQKKELLTQGKKKSLEITESAAYVPF